jgi:DNA-binding response OmpR family regulator
MSARLRKLETACLAYLTAHPDRYVDRRELLTEVWNCSPELVTRRVDAAIAGIRKAMGYESIESCRAGYKFKN